MILGDQGFGRARGQSMASDLGAVLVGGALSIAGGLVATLETSRRADRRATVERAAALEEGRRRHIADTLQELQLATVHLMRAVVEYRWIRSEELTHGEEYNFESAYERVGPALIDAMMVVQILAGRIPGQPAAGAADVVRRCASNMMTPHLPADGMSALELLEHQLDEALAHGERAITLANEALIDLPAPTNYRPLVPWSMRDHAVESSS